jgi:ribonuclease HII
MIVCGVDEAGRGPWAGPVVAAAVILRPEDPIAGLGDSKTLTARARARLEQNIATRALSFAVAEASVEEIDRLNIRQATFLAMRRAVERLTPPPDLALVDGRDAPDIAQSVRAIIGGDATEPAISAASILAKEHRDRLMIAADAAWPGYGFARHKGYGVAAHADALRRLGPCILHRTSFAPIRALLNRP